RIKPKLLRDVLPENNDGKSLIPQLLSKSAEEFIVLSQALYDLGYKTVNWNLGCPYPMVAKKQRGSGLLPYPERIDAILEKVLSAIANRLSVKVRLGRFQKEELLTLIPIFNRYPLTEIIIHPRTGAQMYTGQVDLDAFQTCACQSVHPVVYNGDIDSLKSFLDLKNKLSNISSWMIGRGILANPFLAEIIKSGQENIADPLTRFKTFHDMLYERYAERLYGPSHLLKRMKGLWGYLARHLEKGDELLKQIRKSVNTKRYHKIVNTYFEQGGGWLRQIE
ncbi:MAG: tRNA-dihydrouridine synthase family protein, partial [Desulfobacteraceae bacterium]